MKTFEEFKVQDVGITFAGMPFWEAVEKGLWEKGCIDYIKSKRFKVAFDIGAWVGPYTLLLSQVAGKVYAFEPDPEARITLISNLHMNNIQNVMVFGVAISDRIGITKLYRGRYGWGDSMSSLDGEGEFVEVSTTTIDNFCKENCVTPDFIKIDVEGHEAEVLVGATCTLEHRPEMLLEVHASGDPQRVYDMLKGKDVKYLSTNKTTLDVLVR